MKESSPSPGYKLSQSLVRGLDVLAALNRHANGSATISQLSLATGLHRTTIKRLLETLRAEAYVQNVPASNLYRLTVRVHSLSSGFRDSIWITETAWPHLRELSRKLVWPCSLVTLDRDEMVVRVSTRSYSPLSFHPSAPGRRLPLLLTAAGRAYFSFCSTDEQDALLDLLRSRNDEYSARANDPYYLRKMSEATRRRGYAINEGEWDLEQKFGGIAVPVRDGEQVIACLNMVLLLSTVKDEDARERFASHLLDTASIIEKDFSSVRGDTEPGLGLR